MSASGPTQTAILGLAKELGVETFKTYAKGKTVLAVGGGRLTVGLDDRGKSENIQRVKEKLGTMAKEVPLAAPWTAKKARERSVFPPVKPPSSY